ncbi:MAG TPA: asparagine synthase (glutamine-hydrolyzing) [Gemmatimonadales bacterium]|nr:asparagine synthase (glutamine-hydrolyzing) [Gemmatimonadales bacterium]
MCGFVGILHRDGRPVVPAELAGMAARIRHRGPDDEGQFVDGTLGLHHLRLSIIDPEGGHQPMTSGPATIVFNGEIYNYVELREELRRAGHAFRTASDTEVLLRLYLEHGPAFVERLNGMFAFVLYDAARRQVVVARDRFGIKPLYVYEDARHWLVASEIKALLAHPAVAAEADPDGIREYLTFQFVLGERTLFRNVRKLEPGHLQVIDLASGAVRTTRYWEPTFAIDTHHTEAYFVERLRDLLDDTVRLQLRSDVPVGTYLSGGMDSSIVTLLAAPRASGRLRTFTGAFREGPEFDETRYARLVAEQVGTTPCVVYPTEDEFVDLMPRLVWHMDEPVAGPGLFPQYMVSRLAASQVKVVLGGQGGDEVFGGYARYLVAYLEQALKGAIFESNEEQEHIVSLASIIPNLSVLQGYGPMIRQFWRAEVFEPMDRRYYRLVDRMLGSISLFSADFRHAYDAESLFHRFQRIFNHPDTKSYYNKMTHFDLVTGLPALLQVEDRVSMACSLESRVPLLDHRIVDLVTSMPPRMKFAGGEMKYILKRAVQPLLPAPILERKDKMGFPVPLHLWARGRAREFFHDILLSRACRERGLYDPDEVAKLMEYESAFGRRLWGLLNLELWHREFIDA